MYIGYRAEIMRFIYGTILPEPVFYLLSMSDNRLVRYIPLVRKNVLHKCLLNYLMSQRTNSVNYSSYLLEHVADVTCFLYK